MKRPTARTRLPITLLVAALGVSGVLISNTPFDFLRAWCGPSDDVSDGTGPIQDAQTAGCGWRYGAEARSSLLCLSAELFRAAARARGVSTIAAACPVGGAARDAGCAATRARRVSCCSAALPARLNRTFSARVLGSLMTL